MLQESYIDIPAKEARNAAVHIGSIHVVTPILPLETLVRDGIKIHLFGKFENVQSVYTFKARGAEWFVYNLMKQYESHTGQFRRDHTKPVLVTASAGNHAQGVALAAKRYGLEAIIYMPKTTSSIKIERVEELGGEVRLVDGVFEAALNKPFEFKGENRNRLFVSPYENPQIMAGQATVGVEILSQFCPFHPNYLAVREYDWQAQDVIITGLGGGGLVSGIGSVVKEFNRKCRRKVMVIGVQAEAADSMYRSIKAGKYMPSSDMKSTTIAEGIAVKKASPRMIATVMNYVNQVVLVREEDIIKGIAYLFQHPDLDGKIWRTLEVYNPSIPFRRLPENLPERKPQVYAERPLNKIEGAAAAPYAAVLFGDKYGEIRWKEIAAGKKELNVVCVLTGSNITNEKHRELVGGINRPKNVI